MLLEKEHDPLSLGEMYMFLAKENKGILSQEILVDVLDNGKIGSFWFANGQKTKINIKRKEHIIYLWKTSSGEEPNNFNRNVSA